MTFLETATDTPSFIRKIDELPKVSVAFRV